jgi:hypothetical protein
MTPSAINDGGKRLAVHCGDHVSLATPL